MGVIMGFYKMAAVVLMLIITLLMWPSMMVKHLSYQAEVDFAWKQRIRIAAEDALKDLKDSSLGYGSKGYNINNYDAKIAISSFMTSLSGTLDEGQNEAQLEQLDVPIIVVFDTHGYTISCSDTVLIPNDGNGQLYGENINLEEYSDGFARITLPKRYYLISDQNAYYYLTYGERLTAFTKGQTLNEIKEMIAGNREDKRRYLHGDIEDLLDLVKHDTQLASTYPLLAQSHTYHDVKYSFINAVLDDVRYLSNISGRNYHYLDYNQLNNKEFVKTFEFSGLSVFFERRQFGSNRRVLESVDSWESIQPREDIFGYITNESKVYCYESCSKHREDEIAGIFPNFMIAAKHGYTPCDFGVLRNYK